MVNKKDIESIILNIFDDKYVNKCNSPKSNPSIKKTPLLEDIDESDFVGKAGSQIKLQNETNENNPFITKRELKSLRDYFGAGFNYINGMIYNTDLWQNVKKQEPKLYEEYNRILPNITKDINNIINKAPRLQENTILYRYGYWEKGLKVGDTGKWDGFTSTSFTESNTKKFKDEGEYKIKILALKGQKGICGDGYTTEDWGGSMPVTVLLAKYKGENEYLLPTNTNYIVKEVDDENKTATVIIY